MEILIMYDISEDKRRSKVEKLLSGYGVRVNYSVFELGISKSEYRKILEKLLDITSKEDNIRIYILTKKVIERSFVLHGQRGIFEYEEPYF